MRHRKDPSFREYYDALPPEVRHLADKSFALLLGNPRHPSLHFKRVREDLWSVRIGRTHRALALEGGNDSLQWFWIGSHADYDRLIR